MLRSCQAQRPGENISEWINFFFDALQNIQELLLRKLHLDETNGTKLLPREKIVVNFIQNNPGCKSGEIAKSLGVSRISIIRLISALIDKGRVEKHGVGSATQYTIT